MSFVNIIARAELKEDLYVNDVLTCENQINTKNITIGGNITLLNDATFDGTFINDFVETDTYLDENGNEVITTESIDLYEKIQRIESKIDTNTLAHSANAAAISSRYTKTASDLRFVNNTDAKITGDINIRATETDQYETLTTKLNGKVNTETLNDYTTTTNLNIELNKKIDIEGFAETYISHLAPLESPSFTGTVLINDINIATAIETNATAIQTNATAIQTNATNIQTNATDIQTNKTAIETNATAIQTNATNIQTNATAIQTNATNIETNATAIQTNATDIQTNATAIQTKEDIDTLKVMINMLASSVQPNFIRIDKQNKLGLGVQFNKIKQDPFPIWGNSFKSLYLTTEDFLTDLYDYLLSPIRSAFAATITEQNQFRIDLSQCGTNNNGTGGFLLRYIILPDEIPKTFPSDIADYRLFFEDDYVANKAGFLSLPQIMRTGELTYTRVSDTEFTITAQYPHFTI